MENFVVKADRGRAVHSDHMLDVDYWVERNYNTDKDTTVMSLSGPRGERLAALHDDPQLAALHGTAVAWRKARFLTLLEDEPFRALFGRLLQTPPSRPVSQTAARFLTRQAMRGRAGDSDDSGTGNTGPL
jgi:hypothetical protein